MMQQIMDCVGTAAAWIVVFSRLEPVIREGRWNERITKAWLFALFFSLFGTFEIDTVYVAFDRLVGINNLSWLLSSIFLVLLIYFLCVICCSKQPRWMPYYLGATIGLLVVAFLSGPANDPESADQIIPSSAPELLFVGASYIFAIVAMSLVPARAFLEAHRNESDLALRLRTSTILLAVVMGITFFVSRFAICIVGFLVPALNQVFLDAATNVTNLPVLILCCLWPLSFASKRFYLALARPIQYFRKTVTAVELNALRARLDCLYTPIAPGRASWWDCLRNPDFNIYRGVIGILDGRRMLDACLEQGVEGGQGNWPLKGNLQEARRLHQALQTIPDSPDFGRLVDGYRDLAKRLGVAR